MEETSFHPLDYVSVLRRRVWWFIVPLVLAVAVGIGLATYLPKQYQATATLGVASSAVSDEILANAPKMTPEERARALSQQLLSRKVLARVAAEEHLDQRMPLDKAVSMIRARVWVTLPQNAQDPKVGMDNFYLSYTDSTPDDAQRITNRLATVFVDETSRMRMTRAEDTTAFLDAQLASSKDRLQGLENRLRDAKQSYMGSLPEQTDANLRMVASLQQQLESNATALRSEQDRLSIIEQQIQSLQQASGAESGAPISSRDPMQMATGRVTAAEQALAAARAAYTDRHPEVQRLTQELEWARAAAAAEKERPSDDRMALLKADPAYRSLTADRERSRLRINELQSIEGNIRGQIGMYQKRVESAPRIEQQFAALQREYDLEKQQYAQLATKRHNADLAQNLQQSAGVERFTVLYPASAPSTPVTPNIPRLFVLAIIGGLVLGAGSAAGREYLDRAVYDARTIQRDYALPVLGEIPRIA